MPKFILDGQEVDFQAGQSIIQAANDHGVTIPHFCWHPGLSVAGNCRICLVEVEKMPKLVIACATLVTEGMVVNTNNEKVIHARNAVMEFLLINHPLDCPICDEAGECKLQDYAFKYSVGASRFDEVKNHKDKRIELGPHVMFDAERCILCSRCIRYCEEIVGDPQLTFINRGERVTITTAPGEKLDNPYSMNVIEICPVGALTNRDFRFRARVWDMSSTESICTGCQNGCNIDLWVRNNTILRITPRENMEVNKWWLCDYGRLETFKFVNDENTRVINPLVVPTEAGILTDNKTHQVVDWDDAISRTISEIKNYDPSELAFIASPFTTLEDNFVLKRFANDVAGSDRIFYIPSIDESFGDDFLRKSDMTPNSKGCELLGIEPVNDAIINDLLNKKIKLVYLIHDSLGKLKDVEEIIKNIEVGILHISNFFTQQNHKATVIFPSTTYAEMFGTFVNYQGRVQRIRPAVTTLEKERLPGEFAVSRLDKFGSHNDKWTKGQKINARPAWKVLTQIAKAMKVDLGYEYADEVFEDITSKVPAFNGLDYEKLGFKGLLISESIPA
jgi:NADH-quinone oxidoreductase subunit G